MFLCCLILALVVVARSTHGAINLDDLTISTCNNETFPCGSGTCTPLGVCVCDPLWSTKTDFVVFDNDCALSFIGIYILWSINIVLLIWTYYKSLNVLIIRFEVFFETRKAKKGYTLFQNKGLLACLFYFGISTPFHFIMAILHLVNPETQIGFDLFPNFCFFLAKLGFYIPAFLVQTTMLSTTLKNDRQNKNLVKGNLIFQSLVCLLSVLDGGLPFITFGEFQTDIFGQVAVMRSYYLIQSLTLLSASFGAWLVAKKFNHAMDKVKDHVEDHGKSTFSCPFLNNKTNKNLYKKAMDIRKKVNELQGTVRNQGLIQGIVYLLMGSIPFFINKHDYFLPISWIAMPILGKKLAHQIVIDKSAKSIMQRLGIAKTGSNEPNATSNGMVTNNKSGPSSPPTGTVLPPTSPQNNTQIMSSMFQTQNPLYHSELRGSKRIINKSSAVSSDASLLEDLLDPQHPFHKKFNQFVVERYASNEVACLDMTLKYKGAKPKEYHSIAKKIMKEFIATDAARAIDVPSTVKDQLNSTSKTNTWDRGSFDNLRRILMFDLKGNFLHSFEKQIENEKAKKTEKS